MIYPSGPLPTPPIFLGDILIVDDIPENLRFLSTVLKREGYKVRSALSGAVAISVAKAAQPDLILLDIKMPEMDGYQVCQQLKADPSTRDIPVIFLSALDQVNDKVQAFSSGGVDYIPKPFQTAELLARVSTHINLRAAQAQIEQLNADLEERVVQRTTQLEQEIGERLRIQEQLLHVVTHDVLTGLPARSFLSQRLAQIINQTPTQPLALLLLKCNHLQTINNSLGHHAVDQLLIAVARRVEICLEPGMLLASYGEETFAVLVEHPINRDGMLTLAQKLQHEIELPFHIDNCSIYLQCCFGIILSAKGYEQAVHFLRDANIALCQADAEGIGKVRVFNPAMLYRASSFFQIQNDLHRALENQELKLVYQPIVSLQQKTLKGAEALLRWHHPQQNIIYPGTFIPIAEETELILAVDRLVLYKACHQLKKWQDKGGLAPSFKLQVNVSTAQLKQPDFPAYLDQVFQDTQVDQANLALEITEYGLMQRDLTVMTNLDQIKKYAINISIDDFGTGYSSLSYLHRLNVDNIKIDQSFIQQIDGKGDRLKVLRAIINLAHDLDMTVTAEGVETQHQLEALNALGCEFAQGYLFGRPVESATIWSSMGRLFDGQEDR